MTTSQWPLIPLELLSLAKILSQHPPKLRSGGGSHRADSAANEGEIVKQIALHAEGLSPQAPDSASSAQTNWYDLSIETCHGRIYIDIKNSTMKQADNTSSISGIIYTLTGLDPGSPRTNERERCQFLKENESLPVGPIRDFYFLVVSKLDPKDVFPVSLRYAARFYPNGSNMPFQAKWSECRQPVYRAPNDARNYLLGTWAESIKKKQAALNDGLPTSHPEFFK